MPGDSNENEPVSEEEPHVPKPPPVVPEGEHGLQSEWTFWFDKKPLKKTANWEENLKEIGHCTSVEGFWSLYSNLLRPSELPKDTTYSLFRDRERPMWESFPQGGCLIIKVKKKSGMVDRLWEEMLFAAIGEAFEEPDVVGVAVAIRQKEDLISLWNRSNSIPVRYALSEKLKTLLTLDEVTGRTIEYKSCQNAMKDRSTFRNAMTYQFVVANSGKKDEEGGNKEEAATS